MKWRRAIKTLLALAFLAGCIPGVSGPDRQTGPAERILFIGNSLTYSNDLPAVLQALADSAGGVRMEVASVVEANFALVDHWNTGDAVDAIDNGGWSVVILQQGPSSVEVNRDSLRQFTQMFGVEIDRVGARAALYSVWPTSSRQQDFPRAIESYTLAASDVDGLLLPVASAWLAAWAIDAGIELYSNDGLHPSMEGTYLAAIVMYAVIRNTSPVGLPPRVRLRSGEIVGVSSTLAVQLQQAAASVTGTSP